LQALAITFSLVKKLNFCIEVTARLFFLGAVAAVAKALKSARVVASGYADRNIG
jgi:hypothetical protein